MPHVPNLRRSQDETRALLVERVEKGKALMALAIRDESSLRGARNGYYTWDEYNVTLLRQLFSTNAIEEEYSASSILIGMAGAHLSERVEQFLEDVSRKLRRLESILERLPLFGQPASVSDDPLRQGASSPTSNKVFVVHGHDHDLSVDGEDAIDGLKGPALVGSTLSHSKHPALGRVGNASSRLSTALTVLDVVRSCATASATCGENANNAVLSTLLSGAVGMATSSGFLAAVALGGSTYLLESGYPELDGGGYSTPQREWFWGGPGGHPVQGGGGGFGGWQR